MNGGGGSSNHHYHLLCVCFGISCVLNTLFALSFYPYKYAMRWQLLLTLFGRSKNRVTENHETQTRTHSLRSDGAKILFKAPILRLLATLVAIILATV